MTVKEGWLGIVKNEDKQFSDRPDPDLADAEKYLEYVDGAPYAHFTGITFNMEDTGQMCVRAKNTQGDYWEDQGSNSTRLRNHKKFFTELGAKKVFKELPQKFVLKCIHFIYDFCISFISHFHDILKCIELRLRSARDGTPIPSASTTAETPMTVSTVIGLGK